MKAVEVGVALAWRMVETVVLFSGRTFVTAFRGVYALEAVVAAEATQTMGTPVKLRPAKVATAVTVL